MKYEHVGEKAEKNRFSWTLDESKYLKLHEIKILRKTCRRTKNQALKQDKTTAVRDWFMVEIGLNTGLRVEEMRELKCGDLHIQQDESSLSVRKGKGDRPRTVRLNEDFKNNCKWFLEWKQRTEQSTNHVSYLLTKQKDKQLTKRALQKAFKRCIEKARLPAHYSVHALRHTYGSHLYIASNHNLRLVQEQLGHSSVKVTEVYASLLDNDVRRAVENLYK